MQSPFSSQKRHLARWLQIAAAIAVIALIAAVLLYTRPLPPRTIVMATGPEGSAYNAIGRRYQEIFARHRVKLELRVTNGSVDNVALLQDPRSGVSVALVQSGITNSTESPTLVSLGTLFYEPFWLFSRAALADRGTAALERIRVSLGTPGSGTYKLGRKALAAVGLDPARMQILDAGPVEAGEALIRGEVDFVGMSLPWDARIVQRLLREPKVDLVAWQRADAFVALHPYLIKLILPRGVADLANDRPPSDLALIATKASLIVRENLHPALQSLLLEAASEIHSGPGVFNKSGQFPAAEPIDLPLSEFAREYYRSGRPFLQRYLPFWLAAFASQLLLLLIPILGVAYPLFRLLPALYGWTMRRRIFRLYGELKFLEAEFDLGATGGQERINERLDHLEERANHMRVPNAFAQLLYTLKLHIRLVRDRVRGLQPEPRAGKPAPTAGKR